MMGLSLVTILTLLPMVGAALLLGMENKKWPRCLAIAVSFTALVITLVITCKFDPASADIQFVERHAWIPTLNVEYFVGVDGLSLALLLLTAIVTPMALLASKSLFRKDELHESPYSLTTLKSGTRAERPSETSAKGLQRGLLLPRRLVRGALAEAGSGRPDPRERRIQ